MYAIFKDGSKQYRVSQGDHVEIDLTDAESGKKVEFDQVLVLNDGKKSTMGTPTVAGAKVMGEVVSQATGPKLRVFRYTRRKGTQCMQGHKQKYTLVKITDIKAK